MAGRQRHLVDIAGIPSRDDQPPRIRIGLERLDDPAELVDRGSIPRRPRTPLRSIDGPQIAVFIGPLIPDSHPVIVQVFDVGVTPDEPQELMHDRFHVQPFRRQQRKSVGQIEPHLMAEDRSRARAGPVGLHRPVLQHLLHELQILSHGPRINDSGRWHIRSSPSVMGLLSLMAWPSSAIEDNKLKCLAIQES